VGTATKNLAKQYMARICSTPGCGKPASGYSTLCAHHKQALRRHGADTQDGVTGHELRPYVKRVEARRAKNPSSEAWVILAHRWEALARHARDTLEKYFAGTPSSRVTVKAAEQVRVVADNVPTELVVNTALAMYLLLDYHPRRFRSDRAFDFQLVRRVRGLTAVNAGAYWDQKANRPKRVYRDLPPRVVETLAVWLKDAFGTAGVMLAKKEGQDAQKAQDERKRLASALEGLE
jgi:hypothetical protein